MINQSINYFGVNVYSSSRYQSQSYLDQLIKEEDEEEREEGKETEDWRTMSSIKELLSTLNQYLVYDFVSDLIIESCCW